MSVQIPSVLTHSIEQGAARLGRTLEVLEWPNGGSDSPCHEVNALLNILYYLHAAQPPFFTYAEGTLPNRGRIDLIGFDRSIAFAMEAKAWGRINKQAHSILADWQRMENFTPLLSEVAHNQVAIDWWGQAEQRWRVIVISSFRGDEVKDAWLSEDEAAMRALMDEYKKPDRCTDVDGQVSGFLALWREIPRQWRCASPITTGERWDSGSGWLLWAAQPL